MRQTAAFSFPVTTRRFAMDFNDSMLLFNLIALGCGCFFLYNWFRLRMSGGLFESSLLVPRGKTPQQCSDAQAYIRYIRPRVLVISIAAILYGAVSMAADRFGGVPLQAELVLMAGVLAVVVWYGVCASRAFRKYWGV
ncbi:hypothetical protein [Intestinimonas butyriciproducens]|jgi:hypothetical protein|uniref:hypothetical protein n=1 Tax=Intestinimonas butyriciproducens TaxID=1297617 RepID=UPI00243121F1